MSQIYNCRSSFEDDRPMIDFELPENAMNDWLTIGKVFEGSLPRRAWPHNVTLVVDDLGALSWDSYLAPGAGGIYSQRFVELAGSGLADFSLLPATLNGEPYSFLRCERRINCFDRSKAIFETYSATSVRILSIDHFVFTSAVPTEDTFFCIPETLELLATQAMASRILNSNLRGVLIEPLP